MGICCKLLLVLFMFVGVFLVFSQFKSKEKVIVKDRWFGSGDKRADDTSIKPFKISVPEDVIMDLKQRLNNSRIYHEFLEDSDNFYYGFNSQYLKTVKDYWLNQYDWRKHEALLNKFEQFTTEIEGLKIHYIHSKAAAGYKIVKPLIVVHGWPGSVQEFYKFIPILNDPKAHNIDSEVAFEVIAPSIPGYGWSGSPKKSGFSPVECAKIFHKLMLRLNFEKYYLQGGDWGSVITTNIGKLYPQHSLGIHVNMLLGFGSKPITLFYNIVGSIFPKYLFSSANFHNFNILNNIKTIIAESGYMYIQATKPDTVGASLNDSPIGLAAYILEKLSSWTDIENKALPDGGLANKFNMDELLTIVTIYWVNGNIVNSQRFYREHFLDDRSSILGDTFLHVATGHSHFLKEIFDKTPEEIASTLYNITFRKEHADGGHFAAYEKPQLLAEDVFTFVNDLERPKKNVKEEF